MRALRTIIIEDDEVMRTLLCAYVERTPGLELLGAFAEPLEAGAMLAGLHADVLLLDIHLPQLDGFNVLASLEHRPLVVVVSGDASHAARSFDHAVIDFLHKPFSYDRFQRAIERVRRSPAAMQLQERQPPPPSPKGLDRSLELRSGGEVVQVRLNDIEVVQGLGNYVRLQLRSGSNLVVSETMTHMEEQLPPEHFIRIHRSYIVALASVLAVGTRKVEWRKGELPLGALYKRRAMQVIKGKA